MSEVKPKLKDFKIKVNIEISEKERAQYSSDVELFKVLREQTLIADDTTDLSSLKKEISGNMKDIERTIIRFFNSKQ